MGDYIGDYYRAYSAGFLECRLCLTCSSETRSSNMSTVGTLGLLGLTSIFTFIMSSITVIILFELVFLL